VQKYGNVDANGIWIKLGANKQEPKERVQKYYERMDKLFQWGQIQDVKQHRTFLGKLRPKIRKLYVVKTYIDIEEVVVVVAKIEQVLGELGETPYEPVKENMMKPRLEKLACKRVDMTMSYISRSNVH